MPQAKLLLDTNIVVDYLNERTPYYQTARLLMIVGRAGELSLWVSSSQVTDLIYILSDGGKKNLMPSALERIRGLRTFVNIYSAGDCEIDYMLATTWKDPEDALLLESALRMKADCIITRNGKDFESDIVKTMDCQEFFDWMREERGLDYHEIDV